MTALMVTLLVYGRRNNVKENIDTNNYRKREAQKLMLGY